MLETSGEDESSLYFLLRGEAHSFLSLWAGWYLIYIGPHISMMEKKEAKRRREEEEAFSPPSLGAIHQPREREVIENDSRDRYDQYLWSSHRRPSEPLNGHKDLLPQRTSGKKGKEKKE